MASVEWLLGKLAALRSRPLPRFVPRASQPLGRWLVRHCAGAVSARLVIVCALVAIGLVSAGRACAQTTSSALKGAVRTRGDQPVSGAVVEARSDATGAVRTAVTDERGGYRIDLLPPGRWTVSVRLQDGRTGGSRSRILQLQQTSELDFVVETALTETVKVSAETSPIDPQRISSELRVDGAQLDSLPLSGRLVTDLALLDSSVVAAPPGGFYGERGAVFVVNGQSGRSNSFLVDGLDNNDQTSGTTLNSFFSQQVIREFVVLTHQFAPEFGRASGGVLNIVTERGENETSAEVFLQGASSGWNQAGEFVSSLPDTGGHQDASGRNQQGFKMGGPLHVDRSFYFLAYERQRSEEVTPYTGRGRSLVPGGWIIAPSRDDSLFLKTDFNLGSSHFLMLRLSGDDRSTDGLNVGGNVTPEAGFRLDERDVQFASALTSVISSDVVNEARLLVGGSTFDQSARAYRSGVERPGGIFGGNSLNRQERREDRFQIVDNLTWRLGANALKFGIDVMHSRTRIDIGFNPNGNFLYNTDDAFEPGDCGNLDAFAIHAYCSDDPSTLCRSDLDCRRDGVDRGFCRFDPIDCPGEKGVDDDEDGTIDEQGHIETYPVVFSYIDGAPEVMLPDTRLALFVQNSCQVLPTLLVDYGFRYDLSTFRLPESARVESSIPNGGAGRDYDNLAPRLGFAWSPGSDARMVVRGGAGVFYDKLVLGFPAVSAITSGTQILLTFPQGFAFEDTEQTVETEGIDRVLADVFFVPWLNLRFSTGTRLDTPYTTQYTLGLERAAGEHGAFRAGVTRALGYHQPLLKDLNPPIGTDPFFGFPVHQHDDTVGSIAAIVTEGRTWYSGLDLGWRWRGKDVGYSMSYTLAKALDMGPDPLKGGIALPPDSNDLRGEKARSDSDRRHRFVVSGEAGLPWLGLRVAGVVQLASGVPFNVTTGKDDNLDGVLSDRPAGVGRNTGEDTPLTPVNRLRAQAGLPSVRSLREPNFFQTDLRFTKPIALKKNGRARAEIFAQVFNLLDRFNGGPVEGRVTSPNFGRPIGQAGPPRTFDFGLKAGF